MVSGLYASYVTTESGTEINQVMEREIYSVSGRIVQYLELSGN